MKQKRVLIILLVSYMIVIGVNLAGNYQYYAAGNDWHYSIIFVLTVTTLSWLGAAFLIGPGMERAFRAKMKPTLKIMLSVFVLIVYGIAVMVLTMKSMVWFFHFHEQSTYSYINNSTYSALFSLVFGLMVSGQQFLVYIHKAAQEKEQMERAIIQSQYDALKSQVNPHFLFNSLNTLTAMIPRQPEMAVRFVEQMSKVFRYSLQNVDENTIDLASELKVVTSYIFLNEQRFEGKLHTKIALTEADKEKKIITQSLLMLVENAIKHNEISVQKPLHIRIFSEGGYLIIENNLQSKMLMERSTNMGLANITKRYALASNMPVVISEENELFTVKIPLL